MTEVIISSALPPLEEMDIPDEIDSGYDPEAPYGRNKDGTPSKKRGRKTGSTNTGAPGERRQSRSRTLLGISEEDLADQITELSIPVAFFSPLASYVIDARAARTAKALVTLANNSPRFAKALKTAASGSAYMELALLPLGIFTAVMVDYGRLSPDAFLSRRYNIDQAYREFMAANAEYIPTPNPTMNANGTESRSGLVD